MLDTDLAFRAQLVIPEQRALFDYWCECCGERAMPARRDITPSRFRRHLSFVSLVDVKPIPQQRYRVRLAGTGLREVFNEELTGKYLADSSRMNGAALDRVVARKKPAQGISSLHNAAGEHLIQFWLKLPLSQDGESVNMIMGYDVFLHVAQAAALTQALSPAAHAS